MKIVAREYRLEDHYRMISAIGEQQQITLWDYTTDKKGTYWLWPVEHKEQGSMVHCGDIRAGQRSEGYGGRVMNFPTKDGVIKIQGPWHSNSDALFEATGIDLRDKHLTWGLIALKRESERNSYVFKDVLHLDPDGGVLGRFERIDELAQKFANSLDKPVAYYMRSHGGSSCGYKYPDGWNKDEINNYWKDQK